MEIQKKIRLKYPVVEIGETLYEVDLKPPHQQEIEITKPPHKCSSKSSEAQKAHRQLF
ncbi:MAG TPA: hypothetical protein VK897_13070 [Anaerolineales bacterium]|nr:hypothetical protein [Anaerolineales bacterium]